MSNSREQWSQETLTKTARELHETKQMSNLVFLVWLVSACASASFWLGGNRHGALQCETNQTNTDHSSIALGETTSYIAGVGLSAAALLLTLFILFRNNCSNSCSKHGMFGKTNRDASEKTPLVEEVTVETPSLQN